MFECVGYAAQSATTKLAPMSFERREPGPKDVQIEIAYCGVCHSDLHTARACDIEMIRMGQIDEAYERMLKSDVKYRFVIDMATLPAAA